MTRRKFGSACSGIEASSAAWLPLGWECVFFSEIELFPCALLAHEKRIDRILAKLEEKAGRI